MHEAPTPSSLHVQDLVRQAFGWSESDDIESALQLQAALHDHKQWNPSMREKTLHKLKDQFLKAPKIVVIGAAVRAEKLRSYDEKTVFDPFKFPPIILIIISYLLISSLCLF